MAPNITMATGVLHEQDEMVAAQEIPSEVFKPEQRKPQLVWKNIIICTYAHMIGLYGLYRLCTSAKLSTSVLAVILYQCGVIGITAGVHRLWSHRAYKANLPLRLILTTFNTIAFQNTILDWARDHRLHHKYSETDADPHNAKRGFFFSHVGWLLCRKHPQVKEKGKGVDIADLYADPILVFQHKHFYKLVTVACFVIPTLIPMYLWEETYLNAFTVNVFRYCLTLNSIWLINSAAHMWGQKPYDKYINPAENKFVSFFTLGEGWHNYHHTFPWDYKTSELGKYSLNLSAAFIDFFAKIGWAYDLKTVSQEMIKRRIERTGDGSHEVWGWGDKDQPAEDADDVIILNKKSS